jgi:non-ribosomal peptide synthetase component F
VAALQASVNEILRRNDVLRTCFPAADGRPTQTLLPELHLPLPVEDLAGLEEEARSREAGRLAEEEALRPFDLAQGPLVRARLVRLSEAEHLLLLNIHHIVFDGWSVGVFHDELTAHYRAFVAGRPSPLPTLPVQYADFAQWQRDRLRGPALERQLAYWRERLGGARPSFELPTDCPRPAVPTHRGAARTVVLPPSLAEGLRRLGGSEGATSFVVLLAGFKALLHLYTGGDIVVGVPNANRDRAELNDSSGSS